MIKIIAGYSPLKHCALKCGQVHICLDLLLCSPGFSFSFSSALTLSRAKNKKLFFCSAISVCLIFAYMWYNCQSQSGNKGNGRAVCIEQQYLVDLALAAEVSMVSFGSSMYQQCRRNGFEIYIQSHGFVFSYTDYLDLYFCYKFKRCLMKSQEYTRSQMDSHQILFGGKYDLIQPHTKIIHQNDGISMRN